MVVVSCSDHYQLPRHLETPYPTNPHKYFVSVTLPPNIPITK